MTNLQRNVKAFIEKNGGYVGAAAKLKVTAVSLQMFMLGNRCYAKTLERIGRVGKDGALLKTSAMPMEKAPVVKKAKKAKAKTSPKAKTKSKSAKPKSVKPKSVKSKSPKAKAKKSEMNGVPTSAPTATKDEVSETAAE